MLKYICKSFSGADTVPADLDPVDTNKSGDVI